MELKKRKTHRLKNFDYGSYGYYYVTICTLNRINLLCDISASGDEIIITPSAIGQKVIECWNNIALFNVNVEIDKFVLMPNHIHGIIIIKSDDTLIQKEKNYTFEISEQHGRRSLQGLI